MNQDIMNVVHGRWVKSESYYAQSALENGAYEKCTEKMKEIVGEKEYDRISDSVGDLACEAEIAGFNSGFRYGVLFMSGMLKGGAL